MAQAIRVDTGYRPRPHQLCVHEQLKRFSVIVAHRRFGKTVLCINTLIHAALSCELENPRYAYVAPLYKQAKAVAWDYVKLYTRAIDGVRYNESELRCDLPNGARITLLGADNPDALRGIYLDGAVLDEVAQMPAAAWSEVIRPALMDRKGWAVFIGTPKGQNAFYDMYQTAQREPDWYAGIFRASETGALDKRELESALREGMSEDEYAQEFECSFTAALKGAYYGKEMAAAEKEGRITAVPWEPAKPVDTAWDLGVGDDTAIWFIQTAGNQHRVIDYYATGGVGLPHYVKALKEKPYVYGKHYAPHDIEVRDFGTGLSRIEAGAALGIKFTVVERQSIEDGIHAVRMALPKCVFDRDKCGDGIKALTHYEREWKEKGGVFRHAPAHTWASHGADAFRYFALGYKPAAGQTPPAPSLDWMKFG